MFSQFIILLLSTVLLHVSADKNPCHPMKPKNGAGVTCEKIRLPNKLCLSCKLKQPLPDGNFRNCQAIYDIDDPACLTQLRKYAALNKDCDPVRPRQLAKLTKENKVGLDYFVYSICEQCCDCIPRGADPTQYKGRKAKNKLFYASRGNCPAHAYYDICQVWPNVRFVSGTGMGDQFNRPIICPLLKKWFQSPASANWLQKSFVPMNINIRNFLGRFAKAARCGNRDTWERCANLEFAQRRL